MASRKKLTVSRGRIFVCDMRAGFTLEGVECALPNGQYNIIVESPYGSTNQFALVLDKAVPTSEEIIGTFSVDMARVGVLDQTAFLETFDGDGEELMEWSASAYPRDGNSVGAIQHRSSGLRALTVKLERDCTCSVTRLRSGNKIVGVRVMADLDEDAFEDSPKRPFTLWGTLKKTNCLKIDLRKAYRTTRNYLRERIRDYHVYENHGPGSDDDTIKKITIGFGVDESSWISVVFDTQGADDEAWKDYLDDSSNYIEFPDWESAVERMRLMETVVVLDHDSGKPYQEWGSIDSFSAGVDAMIRSVFLRLREEQAFQDLPLDKSAEVRIVGYDALHGWPYYSESEFRLARIGRMQKRKNQSQTRRHK